MNDEERERFLNEIPNPPMHFDRLGVPICLREWGELMDDMEYRGIGYTLVGGRWAVSTVWTGIDMGLRWLTGGPPAVFETMVFDRKEDSPEPWRDWEQRRYATEAAARDGHEQMVQLVMTLENTTVREDV